MTFPREPLKYICSQPSQPKIVLFSNLRPHKLIMSPRTCEIYLNAFIQKATTIIHSIFLYNFFNNVPLPTAAKTNYPRTSSFTISISNTISSNRLVQYIAFGMCIVMMLHFISIHWDHRSYILKFFGVFLELNALDDLEALRASSDDLKAI